MKILDVTKCIGCRRGECDFELIDGANLHHKSSGGNSAHLCGNSDDIKAYVIRHGVDILRSHALPQQLLKEIYEQQVWWKTMVKIATDHRVNNDEVYSIFLDNFRGISNIEAELLVLNQYQEDIGRLPDLGDRMKLESYDLNKYEEQLIL